MSAASILRRRAAADSFVLARIRCAVRRRLAGGAVVVRRRERGARVHAAVDKGGRQVVAERGGGIVESMVMANSARMR